MKFEDLLWRAKEREEWAVLEIIDMYRPLLLKNSVIERVYDEDLYQELVKELLTCIQTYEIMK